MWPFKKKKIFSITYTSHAGYLNIKKHFIVKATDIAHAAKIIQRKEYGPISIISWEVLD